MQSEIFMYFVICIKVYASSAIVSALCIALALHTKNTRALLKERSPLAVLVLLSLHQKQATPNCKVGHFATIPSFRLLLSSLLVELKYMVVIQSCYMVLILHDTL